MRGLEHTAPELFADAILNVLGVEPSQANVAYLAGAILAFAEQIRSVPIKQTAHQGRGSRTAMRDWALRA